MYCIYCGEEKPDSEASDEHIIPRSMGGNLHPTNPFKTNRVCRICNSNSGIFIDGEFVRGWFFQNSRAMNVRDYADIPKKPILPLSYKGYLTTKVLNGCHCEVWTGPTGDTVFHFHKPYPDLPRETGHVGPPITSSFDIDPGFVFLYVVANNPIWHPVILKSVLSHFEPAPIYIMNGEKPPVDGFETIPDGLKPTLQMLKTLMSDQLDISFKQYKHWGVRFLIKLALGCGCIFLDERYAKSQEADNFRRILWEFDEDAFSSSTLPGTAFISSGPKEYQALIRWPAGHVIGFLPTEEGLGFFTVVYGDFGGSLLVTKDRSLWDAKIIREGLVYVIDPNYKDFVGPITLMQYGEAIHGLETYPIDIRPFLRRAANKVTLPPYHVSGAEREKP